MERTYFEIVNSARRKNEPCGMLSFSPNEGFRIELSENATVETVPAMFVPFVRRGEKVINDKWARQWVQERIPPPGRQNLGEILNAHGLNEYDELTLLRASQAKSSQDDFIVREIEESSSKKASNDLVQNRKSIGGLIRNRREALGLSQSDLAQKIGIDQPSLSRIEAGKKNVTIDLLTSICRAIDIAKLPLEAEGYEQLWNDTRIALFREIRAISNDLAQTYKRLVEQLESYSSDSESRAIDSAIIGHCFRELVNSFPEYVNRQDCLAGGQNEEREAHDKLLTNIAALPTVDSSDGLEYLPVSTAIIRSLKEYAAIHERNSSYAEERISAAAYGNPHRRGIAMQPWKDAGKIGAQNAHLQRKESPLLPNKAAYIKQLDDLEHAIRAKLDPIFDIKKVITDELSRANRTDARGRFEQPSNEAVRHLATLVNSDIALESLFFRQLRNPLWLEALDEIGYFESYLMSAEKNADAAFFTPMPFFELCAQLQPSSVLPILRRLSTSESDAVKMAIVEIACALPSEPLSELVISMAKWPLFSHDRDRAIPHPKRLAELISKALDSGSQDAQRAALLLFQSATELHADRITELYTDVAARIGRYQYGDFVSSIMQHIPTIRRFGLCKRNIIAYIKLKDYGFDTDELSACFLIPSLQPDVMTSFRRSNEYCAAWIAEMLAVIQEQLQDRSEKVMTSIMTNPPIIKRIIFQAIHNWINAEGRASGSEEYLNGLLEFIFSCDYLFDRRYEGELLPLLKDFARIADGDFVASFFKMLNAKIENKLSAEYRRQIERGIDKQQAYRTALRETEFLHRSILAQFDTDQLPLDSYRALCTLERKMGVYDGPRRPISTSTIIGPNSPMSCQTFLSMGPERALRFLELWHPTSTDVSNLIDRDGVSRMLSHAFQENPFYFQDHMDQVRKLCQTYLQGILSGWQDAIKDGVSIPLQDAIALCLQAAQQNHSDPSNDSIENSHAVYETKLRASRLLKEMLESKSCSFTFDDMDMILDSLGALMEWREDENEEWIQKQINEGDVWTATINSLRGDTISSLGRWLVRDERRSRESTEKALSILSSALPTTTNSAVEVSALSAQIPRLLDKNYDWIRDNYTAIFGGNAPTFLQKLSLSTILTLYRPSPHILDYLRPSIATALDNRVRAYPRCSKGLSENDCLWHVGAWLYECYVVGGIGLDDTLLVKWEELANAEEQASVLNHICVAFERTAEIPSSITDHMRLLWEHCEQQNREDPGRLYGAIRLLASGCFDDGWIKTALLSEAKSRNLLEDIFLAQEQIEALAESDPYWGIVLLRSLLNQGLSSDYYIIEDISVSLLKTFLTAKGSPNDPTFKYCRNRLGKLGMIDLDERLNLT